MQDESFFLWAHRGASLFAPENTLAAFRAAEAAGAHGIELDVHVTRDGVPVVIHDTDVKRTTNGSGTVTGMLLQDLKRLDAGGWFSPGYSGERVPTLSEVLEWAQDRVRLNIEIKASASGEAVLRLLRDFPAARVLVSSFNHNLLSDLRQCQSALSLGFLVETLFWGRALKKAANCRAESLHPRIDRLSPAMVNAARRLGLKIYPWTVNDPASLPGLKGLGVDGLFTDDPAVMVQALKMTRQSGKGHL
jgi:glycerophosphoryl diester phosphodiesterase